MQTTKKVLSELGVENKKILYVFNKADKLNYETQIAVDDPFVIISATKKYNLDKLYSEIEKILLASRKKVDMKIPYKDSNILAQLKSKYQFEETYDEDSVNITLNIDQQDINIYKEYIIAEKK